ncbi:CRP/FNR family transcriptional regulator [Labrenzia sp. MBR-25]
MTETAAFQTNCRTCPLRQKTAFRPLEGKELDFISNFKSGELTVEAGATIVQEENKSPHLYTILDGWAFRHKTLKDGRRQVLNFALPGDLVGIQLAVLKDMQHSVTALTDTTLCVFQRDKVWSIFKDHPGLAFAMTWIAAREEQILDGHIISLGQRTALERLSYLILHLYDRAQDVGYASNQMLDAPFSQSHLSDALGITPVHTSRTLRKLFERGLISWERDRIRVLDRDALAKLASYEAVLDEPRPLI